MKTDTLQGVLASKRIRVVAFALLGAAVFICALLPHVPQGPSRRLLTLKSWLSFGGDSVENDEHVGYFLRELHGTLEGKVPMHETDKSLEGISNFRILPGYFPKGMKFHFDGLAAVLKFEFKDGALSWAAKAYESDAFKDFGSCVFAGTGTGPTLGTHPCLANPAVNLLPIENQLWLTIDTSMWGRMDPSTLETLPNKVNVPSTVLNAHPACEKNGGACFVEYNCDPKKIPLTDQACIGLLKTEENGDMEVQEISRSTLPFNMLIQHSHSPCLTENFVVVKLDSFGPRSPLNSNTGMLKYLHQDENKLWMVMDRRTNQSKIIEGDFAFVNNHFWNCVEVNGEVVVDAVAATSDYLDNYFEKNLDQPHAEWNKIFFNALRCHVPTQGETVHCENFFAEDSVAPKFDYPTFNPDFKMNPSYRYFYAIAGEKDDSRWFDELIKVDAQARSVAKSWSAPGIYMTEADFVPKQRGNTAAEAEDDGTLLAVLYNATSDSSFLAVFDTQSLTLTSQYPLPFDVPFHSHGIVCATGLPCYTNP